MYILSGVWQDFGWGSIIYLAALTGVSTEMHEAAVIDGATRFQRILYVDFPCILPTITIMLILRMGAVMSIGFEKVFLMQNALNLPASEVISTYVYKIGLTGVSDFSYSTAIGLFNSVVNLIFIGTVNLIARRLGETSLW
jgi:putative aldouronate transport system permease protein